MRIWLALLLPLTLLAQESADKKEATTEKKDEKAAAESPQPQKEKELTGYIDVGARWVGRAGDFNTYRSLVNLSQGTRLLGMDIGYEPAANRLFTSLRIQGYNWGGDPYNTARFDLQKRGIYRYVGSYSNIAYYNYLPSFADVTANKGVYMNQRSYDTTRRNFENELTLFPGARIMPYLGYSRNSDSGNGITTLVADMNEYPLRNLITWGMNEVRGGVRIEMNRWHVTLEEGGTNFKDDQGVYSTEKLTGNRTSPYLGQSLYLLSGAQYYRVRGNGAYTKVLLTANPWNWLDLSGTLVRTAPKTYATYNDTLKGSLVSGDDPLLIIPQITDSYYGNVRMPHTSANASAEVRPMERLRVRTTWETDRFHTSGSGVLTTSYFLTTTAATGTPVTGTDGERLDVTRNRQQVEALYDISKKYTVRGGYRYEWGSVILKANQFITDNPTERGELQRHVGLFGFLARPVTRLTLTGDFELADGVKTYYRSGLMDTKRINLQSRLSLPKSLFFNLLYSRFDNKNPTTGINLDATSQATSANLQWMPKDGKRISIIADYTRSTIKSDFNYLYPLGLFPVQSLYRDNAHSGTLMADLRLPLGRNYSGHLTFGGSFVTTAGTRPSNYYQPQGRIQLPVTPKLEFFSEWKYYGLHQPNYYYEGFRSNMFTGGVRFVM
ncbi:porin family protein [Paludibaculum fermentans]|uniref:Uncharacterized protein n=1 Tax=Paludibaculum fermentans TaxID=1473598 RepID=A0A7S7NTA8_PALFE|nr:hypothetical protein [Paludibaculum fermentans]QOY89433.1 hypothetical protein IRI77_05620 [Paludibaculum fermentans]